MRRVSLFASVRNRRIRAGHLICIHAVWRERRKSKITEGGLQKREKKRRGEERREESGARAEVSSVDLAHTCSRRLALPFYYSKTEKGERGRKRTRKSRFVFLCTAHRDILA